jgi:putative transposase
MQEATTKGRVMEFRQVRQEIRRLLQDRILEAVEVVLAEELQQALDSEPYERTPQRRGYRNGGEQRRLTTVAGTREVRVPRGRLIGQDGTSREFQSQLLPRYARRTREIDEAILSCYLAGANSRRIRLALQPLWGEEHLSKSAVSRVVGRLKELFAAWSERDLSGESYAVLYLDGFHLKVRLARRVVSAPVLAVLGVRPDGQKVLVALRLAASEAEVNWAEVVVGLQRRGLAAPRLLMVDGHQGLGKALAHWSGVKIQRCTTHKARNLGDHCPQHARAEMKRDYDRMVYAKDGLAARGAYDAFLAKWSKLCPAVARVSATSAGRVAPGEGARPRSSGPRDSPAVAISVLEAGRDNLYPHPQGCVHLFAFLAAPSRPDSWSPARRGEGTGRERRALPPHPLRSRAAPQAVQATQGLVARWASTNGRILACELPSMPLDGSSSPKSFAAGWPSSAARS